MDIIRLDRDRQALLTRRPTEVSTATSKVAGTLCRVTGCGVSRAETISGKTAFFAPLIG
jgi:hypothetical protein